MILNQGLVWWIESGLMVGLMKSQTLNKFLLLSLKKLRPWHTSWKAYLAIISFHNFPPYSRSLTRKFSLLAFCATRFCPALPGILSQEFCAILTVNLSMWLFLPYLEFCLEIMLPRSTYFCEVTKAATRVVCYLLTIVSVTLATIRIQMTLIQQQPQLPPPPPPPWPSVSVTVQVPAASPPCCRQPH